MGKQSKVSVREWLDQCAPDEVRDAVVEQQAAAVEMLRCLRSQGVTEVEIESAIERLDNALSEPQV